MRLTKEIKPTATVRLDARKILKKTNNYSVKLFVWFNGKRKDYTLNINLTKEEWEVIYYSRTKNKNFDDIRKKIRAVEAKADQILSELGDQFDFESFEYLYYDGKLKPKKDAQDVYEAFRKYIKELKDSNQLGTAEVYENTLHALQRYRKTLRFEDVTISFLNKYERYMLYEKELSQTTLAMDLRNLRRIMNVAKSNKVISDTMYPFGSKKDGKYQIGKPRKNKRAIEMDGIDLIVNYQPKRKCDKFGKAMWLFIYYGNGMNVADLIRLKFKNIDGDFIRFYREKTKRTAGKPEQISVFLSPILLEIIEEYGNKDKSPNAYIFPFIEWEKGPEIARNQKKSLVRRINDRIQHIAKEVGLDKKPTTYSARHSFGTNMLKQGAPMPFIQKCYGHASLAQTEDYIGDFTEQEQKEFGKLLYGTSDKQKDTA